MCRFRHIFGILDTAESKNAPVCSVVYRTFSRISHWYNTDLVLFRRVATAAVWGVKVDEWSRQRNSLSLSCFHLISAGDQLERLLTDHGRSSTAALFTTIDTSDVVITNSSTHLIRFARHRLACSRRYRSHCSAWIVASAPEVMMTMKAGRNEGADWTGPKTAGPRLAVVAPWFSRGKYPTSSFVDSRSLDFKTSKQVSRELFGILYFSGLSSCWATCKGQTDECSTMCGPFNMTVLTRNVAIILA